MSTATILIETSAAIPCSATAASTGKSRLGSGPDTWAGGGFPACPFSFGADLDLCYAEAFLALLVALRALARVFAGVHYPLDVMAGAAIGILSASLVRRGEWLAEPVLRFVIQFGRRLYLA